MKSAWGRIQPTKSDVLAKDPPRHVCFSRMTGDIQLACRAPFGREDREVVVLVRCDFYARPTVVSRET